MKILLIRITLEILLMVTGLDDIADVAELCLFYLPTQYTIVMVQ